MHELIREIQRQIDTGKLTVQDLAKAVGVSRTTICLLLNGDYRPNLDVVERLAAAVGFELVFVRLLPRKQNH